MYIPGVNKNTSPENSAVPTDAALPTTKLTFYSAQAYQPEESLGYLMRHIMSLFVQGVERELEPTGLTHAQWMPMLKLHRGCAATVAELARECEHDPGSMTRLLDRLETKELCQRVRSSDDRRVVNIELTPAGRSAAEGIPVVLSKLQNDFLAGFSVEEWQTLKSYLRRILDTAQSLQASKEENEA